MQSSKNQSKTFIFSKLIQNLKSRMMQRRKTNAKLVTVVVVIKAVISVVSRKILIIEKYLIGCSNTQTKPSEEPVIFPVLFLLSGPLCISD